LINRDFKELFVIKYINLAEIFDFYIRSFFAISLLLKFSISSSLFLCSFYAPSSLLFCNAKQSKKEVKRGRRRSKAEKKNDKKTNL
jgi:hypothetical protein